MSLRSRPKKRHTDRELAAAWRHAVCAGAACAVCGSKAGIEGHHVLSQQWLRGIALDLRWAKETLERWRWDPRNGIALCQRCHQRHEVASRRVRIAELPYAVFAFVEDLDALFTDGRAPALLRLREQYGA